MGVLLGIGFLAGVITALSPCVLPVLPIVLAGGASGGRRRPYAIVAGLVASFTVFTLSAAALLKALGLPQDLLRNVAIALLFVVAATLVSTRVAHLVERPFYVLTRRRVGDAGGGFVLGVGLGLVFVPCAGPVLAAVTVLAANRDVGADTVALTLAYAVGAGVPLLAIAVGGRRVSAPIRARMPWLRPLLGGVVALTALAIALGADTRFQTSVPGYTEAFQKRVERSSAAERELSRLTGSGGPTRARERRLADYGPAPDFAEIEGWINTPGDRPLTLAGLRGKVVVLDFWTYSCINCLRTLPYLKAWDRTYRQDGLVIVGVHTPEFAFERVPSNVRRAVRDLGLRYPVALDSDFGTWNAWQNRYWPAKYFVDRRGHVRFAHFGEGEYGHSEEVIRQLLAEGGERPTQTAQVAHADTASSQAITPETYLGYERLNRGQQYVGAAPKSDEPARYEFPRTALGASQFAYDGVWRVEGERIVAGGAGARLRLHFRARDVHLVLGGRGTVAVRLNDVRVRTVRVTEDRLYTLLRLPKPTDALLDLRFSPGLEAYAFTFG